MARDSARRQSRRKAGKVRAGARSKKMKKTAEQRILGLKGLCAHTDFDNQHQQTERPHITCRIGINYVVYDKLRYGALRFAVNYVSVRLRPIF